MRRRAISFGAAFLILCSMILPGMAAPEDQGLTILFTHDMHDHILPMKNEQGGEFGGFTRLATLLKQERAASEYPVITVDAGDFSMGTLYQTIYTTDAPALRLMGTMGFDAATFGNHEYDYRFSGLADMLNAAVASGDRLPAIVQANYKPPKEDTVSWEAWRNYGISDYAIIERDGLRVAVFGLMGLDAHECSPMSGMEFEPIADAAKRTVDYLNRYEEPDFIVCLSHAGTEDGKGEDYDLAVAVDGIDVIISGHTHTTLHEPIKVNDTLIVSCGNYIYNLGSLTIVRQEDGIHLLDYRLLPVDETVADDPEISRTAEKMKCQVEETYLSDFGYTFDQVLTTNEYPFTLSSQFAQKQEEDSLGNLIADSYLYAVQQAEGEDYVPIDFAVVAYGVIRDTVREGEITVSDAFNISSLGSGADGTPGYPLVSVYLTGDELKNTFEVDASVTPIMSAVQLYGAGMTWSYNTNRMIFNKVFECAQMLEDGSVVPLERDRLYRVVTGLYSAQMLGTVKEKSFGLLSIEPKDADGNPITDFEKHIIKNENGSEVKEWFALASYLDSLDQIPANYSGPEGRKIVSSSWNPVELLRAPNWLTLLVMLIVLVLIAVIVLIVHGVARRRRNRHYRKSGRNTPRAYRGRRRR